ncbi:techylectin-5A-like isoform X3 [Tachypleus tridentatus]
MMRLKINQMMISIQPVMILLLVHQSCQIETNLKRCQMTSESTLLDSIIVLVTQAKDKIHSDEMECLEASSGPRDCTDVFLNGNHTSGVYRIWPKSWMFTGSFDVYCDMDTDGGGWTVIQRRGDYGNPTDYFYKSWQEYKMGFGDIDKDFWLGNYWIFTLTNQGTYSIRFDLTDKEGEKRFALYREFRIDNEELYYRLHVKGFTGDAGDSLKYHNGLSFSTKDSDHDTYSGSCAESYKGGWWYGKCHSSNLNGLYLNGEHESYANGVNWKTWKGYHYSLKTVSIKIRPLNFDILVNNRNIPM